MPIGSPVPGPEQPRIDWIFTVEDGMTAWIAHDVEQQQTCGRVCVLERVDRQAVVGAVVRRQLRIVGLLVSRGAGYRVERSQVDIKCKLTLLPLTGLLGLSLSKNQ
jgi:hypothetical protein